MCLHLGIRQPAVELAAIDRQNCYIVWVAWKIREVATQMCHCLCTPTTQLRLITGHRADVQTLHSGPQQPVVATDT